MTFEGERKEWEEPEEPHVQGELVDSYFAYYAEDENFILDKNADGHTVKLIWVDEYRCDDCHGGLCIYDETKTETSEEGHWWTAEGVCELCGYENACDHSVSSVQREEWEDYRRPVTGGKQHKITYDIVDVTYCDICGQYLGKEVVELHASQLENHWLDEEGFYRGEMPTTYEDGVLRFTLGANKNASISYLVQEQ
jgi:hypothetical protein